MPVCGSSISRDNGEPEASPWPEATALTPKLAVVVGSTFVGTLLGACAAGLLLGREWSYNGPDLSIPVILAMYVLDAALVVVCALLALYLRYRSVPDIRTGILWVGLGLVAGGLVSLAPAIAFASTTGYSNQRGVQAAEVVIVAACCLIGIAGGPLCGSRPVGPQPDEGVFAGGERRLPGGKSTPATSPTSRTSSAGLPCSWGASGTTSCNGPIYRSP
jgi:hypothetical protein